MTMLPSIPLRLARRALAAGNRIAALRAVCLAMAGDPAPDVLTELVGVLDAIRRAR